MSTKKAVKANGKPDVNRLKMVLEYRWDPKYIPRPVPKDPKSYQLIQSSNPLLENLGHELQAIFINIRWCSPGVTIEQFKQLQIHEHQMANGIVFVWCEKDNITELIDHFESQMFTYVENFTLVMLSLEKIIAQKPAATQSNIKRITDFFAVKKQAKEEKVQEKLDKIVQLDQLPDLDPVDVFCNEPYQFFRKTKRTLLMFRRISKQQLELRHQRTGDIFFDLIEGDAQTISPIGLEYIYQMIETLLPKAKYREGETLKMMELFAGKDTRGREGWIHVMHNLTE